jgi:hypothetical protein
MYNIDQKYYLFAISKSFVIVLFISLLDTRYLLMSILEGVHWLFPDADQKMLENMHV